MSRAKTPNDTMLVGNDIITTAASGATGVDGDDDDNDDNDDNDDDKNNDHDGVINIDDDNDGNAINSDKSNKEPTGDDVQLESEIRMVPTSGLNHGERMKYDAENVVNSNATALDDFRKEWKLQLSQVGLKKQKVERSSDKSAENVVDNAAAKLFLEGVGLEREGQMWDAVQRYMGAMRLDPDIECKLYRNKDELAFRKDAVNQSNSPIDPENSKNHMEVENLRFLLHRELVNKKAFVDPEKADESCPFSKLPIELLRLITKHVVGENLDVRCLEMLSMVSIGFFVLSRDESLWREICSRTFGEHLLKLLIANGSCGWRNIYVNCPHVYNNGVYIGKITYMRFGEASFQDRFYKPWHIVNYFRILRFFADGTVIMMTTVDKPAQVVGLLKTKAEQISGALIGRYWNLDGNSIAAQFNRCRERAVSRTENYVKFKHRGQFIPHEVASQEYNLILSFGDGRKRRPHCILHWNDYNCCVKYGDGNTSNSEININDSRTFPALYFSRVKSYAFAETNVY